jgi:hypothetical protein
MILVLILIHSRLPAQLERGPIFVFRNIESLFVFEVEELTQLEKQIQEICTRIRVV